MMTVSNVPPSRLSNVQRLAEGLAILALGMFAGVMLFIGITLGGYWQSLDPQQFLDWFALNNLFIQKTIPLVAMPALLATFLSVSLFWKTRARWFWLSALFCLVVVTVLTFGFFVPANSAFASGQILAGEATSKLSLWLQVHWFRIIFGTAAAVFAYLAIRHA